VIAHRLSTVRDCGLILALKQGRLAAMTPNLDHAIRALAEGDKAGTRRRPVAPVVPKRTASHPQSSDRP
jgi:hypothetical protein